jgi:hypothetical protein
MRGKIKRLIDELIEIRTRGNTAQAHFVRSHLVLNGIDPARFDESSPDDAEVIATLEQMISQFDGTRD